MEEDGFTLVKRKRRQSASQHQNSRENTKKKRKIFDTSFLEIDNNDEMLEKLERCCEHLNRIAIFDETFKFLEAPQDIEEIVCFGLGNFASCSAALYQLAWLKLTATRMGFDSSDKELTDKESTDKETTDKKSTEERKPLFFDPNFTDFEKGFLTSVLNYSLLNENTECRHPVSGKAFFYMPRCYKTHYDNLLKSNIDHLTDVQIFSTSFDIMFQDFDPKEQPTFSLLKSKDSPFKVIEKRIPDREELFNIFTYQAIHSFESIT